jgi:hypothetical protein
MLEVKVNLVPLGIRSREKQIGYVKIWNDGTGSVKIGNYCYRIENEDEETIAEGEYKNFPRLEKNVFHLLQEILNGVLT